jgi:predicted dehydrogenase
MQRPFSSAADVSFAGEGRKAESALDKARTNRNSCGNPTEERIATAMLTLGQAALETGMAKSAISRAIKSGRLSARKTENGSFEIDPAELFRVYPPASSRNSETQPQGERIATPGETNGLHREVAVLRELIEEIKGERDGLRGERDRLLRVIEEQAGTVKQLTHQPEPKAAGPLPEPLPAPQGGFLGASVRFWAALAMAAILAAAWLWWERQH